MIQQEWDAEFTKKRLELQNDHGVPARRAWERANAITAKHYGPRPGGPPGHVKFVTHVLAGGEGVKKLKDGWDWLNGKKTLIGSILVGVPVIWETLSAILAAGGVNEVKLAAIGGIIVLIVGWAHKLLKVFGVVQGKAKDGTV